MLWQRAVTNILIFVSIGFSEIDQTLKLFFWGGGGGGGGASKRFIVFLLKNPTNPVISQIKGNLHSYYRISLNRIKLC